MFVGDSAIFRGYATPRYTTTLTNGFDFLNKTLRLTTLLDWRSGNRWYNNTERIRCTRPNCSGRLNLNASLRGPGDERGGATSIPPARSTATSSREPSSACARCRSSTRSPRRSCAALARGRSLSVVASGRNLKLWTNYRGTDPESGFNTTSGTEAPSEFQTVGPPSYALLRFNLGF